MAKPRIMLMDREGPLSSLLQDDLEDRGYPSAWISSADDEVVGPAFDPDVLVVGMTTPQTVDNELLRAFAHDTRTRGTVMVNEPEAESRRKLRDALVSNHLSVVGVLDRPFAADRLTQIVDRRIPSTTTAHGNDEDIIAALIRSDRLIPNLTVDFQAKHCLKTNEVAGYEALTRLKIRRAISPEYIFSQAVHLDVEIDATFVVINAAAELAARLVRSGRNVPVSFNCSAAVLSSRRIVDQLIRATRCHRVAPRWLTLEITEDARLSDKTALMKSIKLLRDLGVSISIDDFGTGMANLDRISDRNFDEIKIDKNIFWACTEGRLPMSFLSSILDFCKMYGCRSVIEGIETEAQFMQARLLNADIGQGFYWGKAVHAQHFAPI